MNEPVFSASQISIYVECQRKWAWRYIAHAERTVHPSAALGSRTHKQLELYLRDGRPLQFTLGDGTRDESGYIAETALPHLPKSMLLGLEVEAAFKFTSPRGLNYRGFFDFRHPHWPDKIPIVGDHKTTSNLGWAKTAKDLDTDIQATIYAYDALAHYHVPQVRLQWSYMQTKGAKKCEPTIIIAEKNRVHEVFSGIEDIASEMRTKLETVDSTQVLTLPPTPSACDAYGGCPFQSRCNLSPQERVRSFMNQGAATMSLVDRLKARRLASVGDAPAMTPGEQEQGTRKVAIVDTVFGPAAEVAPDGSVTPEQLAAIPQVQAGQINPPEQSAPITVLDKEPAKRGRPAGSKNRVKEGSTNPLTAPNEPPEDVKTTPEAIAKCGTEVPQPNPVRKIPFLFVDCLPYGFSAPLANAAGLAEAANQKVKTARSVEDYRYLEYGQGPGALLQAAYEVLESLPGAWPSVTLDSATPEGSVLLNGLMNRAMCVVRGTR